VLIPPVVRHGAGKVAKGGALAFAIAAASLALPPHATADPPAPASPASPAAAPTLTPFDGNVEIEDRLDTASRPVVAGERLHEHLVRRFYQAHGYHTVWDRHPAAAAALWAAVQRAGEQGLDPASFHSAVLGGDAAATSPIDHDILVSDAVLAYADALARGAMPVETRPDNEDLQPQPIDAVAAVDAAITAPDPGAAIEALAPAWPEYLAMRRAYAGALALAASAGGSGAAGPHRQQTRVSVAGALLRARQIAINLERLRWLPRDLPADRLVVNTAIAQLQLFRDDRPVFTTRVVIGEFDKQTPELQSIIQSVLFNPPWNVPRSIFEKEILPKLAADRHYLAEHHMRYRGPMAVQQEAGPFSALGRLKFEMDDRFDVYLHDTPEKWRFHAANRMMSHGCVRVENPQTLASLLLGANPEEIERAIDIDHTHRRALPKPLPVFIVYHTADVESDGSIAFYGDPYRRDPGVWAYLSRAESRPMAQRSGGHPTERVKTGQASSTAAQKTSTMRD
jgi:L,D-transpeptidase YcbB